MEVAEGIGSGKWGQLKEWGMEGISVENYDTWDFSRERLLPT
jgi:hypothetical protein